LEGIPNYLEDKLLVGSSGSLELLLDETRAVLVTRELNEVADNILEVELLVLVAAELLEEGGADRRALVAREAEAVVVRRRELRSALGTIVALRCKR